MAFESGRFFRRRTDGIVYRCEKVQDVRALLHVADLHADTEGKRRLVVRENDADNWEKVAESDEAPYLATYSRDASDEHGIEVGEQAIVYRRQYHLDPYLSGVSDDEIRTRLDVIADNSIRYDSNGSLKLRPPDELALWHRKSEEVLEHLRTSDRKDFFIDSDTNPRTKVLRMHHDIRKKQGYDNCVPWGRVPALSQHSPRPLFKFGEAGFLQPALEKGRFQIKSALSYSDPSLNFARQDSNDGRIVLRPSQTGFPIVLRDQANNPVFKSNNPRNYQIALEIGGDIDCYVMCCSRTYEPRLFVDFQADACLAIYDLEEFAKRLNRGLHAKVPDTPFMYANDVRYYDPLAPDDAFPEMFKMPMALFFHKDFRYTYQAEYRFVWLVKGKSKLTPIELDIGPLTDICELVKLSTDTRK